jgi:hypothetical protein
LGAGLHSVQEEEVVYKLRLAGGGRAGLGRTAEERPYRIPEIALVKHFERKEEKTDETEHEE